MPQNRLPNQTTNEEQLNRQLSKKNLLWAIGVGVAASRVGP